MAIAAADFVGSSATIDLVVSGIAGEYVRTSVPGDGVTAAPASDAPSANVNEIIL